MSCIASDLTLSYSLDLSILDFCASASDIIFSLASQAVIGLLDTTPITKAATATTSSIISIVLS